MPFTNARLYYNCCLLMFFVHVFDATEYFVSLDGSDSNPGTKSKPWRHVIMAAGVLKPGDVCTIRGGRYNDYVLISGLKGTADEPITFRAYPGETVVFDGTTKIDGDWSVHSGSIFTTTPKQPVWQLFVDDDMQVNARWPDAFWYDFSIFENSSLASSANSSTYNPDKGTGVMVDNGDKNLAHSGINATGAIAILNIGSWKTFAGTVERHEVGSNSFEFDLHQIPGTVSFKPDRNRYYLEDKLELLDAATEWFYDKVSKRLYLWPSDGKNPSTKDVRGKVSTYLLNITNGSSHLVFSGIHFFAATLVAASSRVNDDVHNIRFDSLLFSYPTYSKRMLGLVDNPNSTLVYYRGLLTKGAGNFTFFNCTFEFADGSNLRYRGADGRFENNLWHHNDFSCVGRSSCGSFCSEGVRDVFIRNTVHSNGPSVGFQPGGSNAIRETGVFTGALIEFNHFYDLKSLQHDGSHVQVMTNCQNETIIQQNWAYDTQKNAFRFDREIEANATWGYNGTMKSNVAWNTNGIMVKGDYHKIDNNLAFDNYNGMSGTVVDTVVLGQPGQGAVGENKHTTVDNNLIQKGPSASRKTEIPISANNHNNVEENVTQLLRDPKNLDFRPKAKSKLLEVGVGPYGKESQQGGGVYWIPGKQYLQASMPIPPNGTVTAKCDAHLMWLAGFNAISHHVYFGTSAEAVARANSSSPEYKVNATMPSNIYDPGHLKGVQKYAWRVDVQRARQEDTEFVEIFKGEVWQFKCLEQSLDLT